jgi:type I restriction-modification system S subunit
MEGRMTAQQLKNSILQMAVQGKLVPQDANDEPASVLLERIRKEKEQLIKDGKIKKNKKESYIFRGADNLHYEQIGKSEPVCIADELPFDIPDSWEWCKLKDVAFVNGGFAFKSTDFINKGTRVIRISDFNENGFINTKIVRHKYDDSLESFLLQKKNILLCMTGGTVGKSYFVTTLDEPMITNQRVATIKIFGALEEYVNLVILSPITQKLINNKKNSTNDNISIDTINNFIIPLPPLKEQERIVERFGFIETFIQLYRINETKLLTLNNSFPESFKKSILQEAIQGKLVPQDENDEPASVLLERIRAEKQKLIAEGKIKKDKNESVIFRRDNSHYEKLNGIEYCIDDEIPFRIPDSWEWIRLGSIGDWGSGATPSRSNPEYYNGDIPWLKTGDLNDGYIEYIPEKISLIALKKTSVRLNPTGSVLIAMYGATIGKVGILTFPSTTNQACCACFPIEIYNEYLFYFLMSQKTAFVKRGEGGAQPNISKEKIIATLMPLPPLAEQFRIAKTLNEVLNEIEKLKK